MKTYTVRCEWDSTGWWVVTVPDQGVTAAEISGAVGDVLEGAMANERIRQCG
jgi:predicted RNase H-like HicB family nuclease